MNAAVSPTAPQILSSECCLPKTHSVPYSFLSIINKGIKAFLLLCIHSFIRSRGPGRSVMNYEFNRCVWEDRTGRAVFLFGINGGNNEWNRIVGPGSSPSPLHQGVLCDEIYTRPAKMYCGRNALQIYVRYSIFFFVLRNSHIIFNFQRYPKWWVF